MKKHRIRAKKLLLFLVFMPTFLWGQQPLQRGKVVQQNSGKKILENVQIQVMGASPEVSDNQGNFRLNLVRHQPGQLIFVDKIEKKGYSVVNKSVVEQWTFAPEKEFCVVMCPTDMLQSNIEKYYNIGSVNYKAKFNQLKQKIEEEKARKTISEKEFDNQYAALVKTLNKEMELLASYSELFARINKDDLSRIETEAFDLLDRGKLDEAVALYEAQKYLEKFMAQVEVEKTADEAIAQLIPSLKTNADVYIFAGGTENYAKAENILRTIACSDTTQAERVKPYLTFLVDQEKYAEAEKWCGILYRNTTSLSDKAEAMNMRGVMSRRTKDPANVEKYYNESIALIDQAFAKDPNPSFLLQKCAIYANLASHFTNQQNNKKAREYVDIAISLGERIAEEKGGKYALGLVFAYMQLSAIDYFTNFPERSIDNGMKILPYIEKARSEEPEKTDYFVALVNNLMASAYNNLSKYDKAKERCDIAIDIMKKLAQKSPAVYRYDLANLFNTKGLSCYGEEDYKAALSCYVEALNLYREAGIRNSVHIDKIVRCFENSALLYRKLGELKKAEELRSEIVAIYDEYLNIDYLLFAPLYAHFLCNIAIEKRAEKQYEEALSLLKRACGIYEQVNKSKAVESVIIDQANCYNLIATLNKDLGKIKEAEKFYLLSGSEYDKVQKQGRVIPAFQLASTYGDLAIFYEGQKNIGNALMYYQKAIDKALPDGKTVSDQCTDLAISCVVFSATHYMNQKKIADAYKILGTYEHYMDSLQNDIKREYAHVLFYTCCRDLIKIAPTPEITDSAVVSRLIASYEYLIQHGEKLHLNIGLLYQNQAQILFDKDKHAEALPHFLKAAEYCETVFNSNSHNEQIAVLLVSNYLLSGICNFEKTGFDRKASEYEQGVVTLEKARKLGSQFPDNKDIKDFLEMVDELLK